MNGVNDENVLLSTSESVVQFDEAITSPEQLKFAVKGAGYGVGSSDNPHLALGKDCCG